MKLGLTLSSSTYASRHRCCTGPPAACQTLTHRMIHASVMASIMVSTELCFIAQLVSPPNGQAVSRAARLAAYDGPGLTPLRVGHCCTGSCASAGPSRPPVTSTQAPQVKGLPSKPASAYLKAGSCQGILREQPGTQRSPRELDAGAPQTPRRRLASGRAELRPEARQPAPATPCTGQ